MTPNRWFIGVNELTQLSEMNYPQGSQFTQAWV
jgi:hypothetical protein